jgi:hypothetical protein
MERAEGMTTGAGCGIMLCSSDSADPVLIAMLPVAFFYRDSAEINILSMIVDPG